MTSNKRVLPLFLASCLTCVLIGYAFGLLTVQFRVANVASIKTVGVNVYSDLNCTQPITEIDWGTLEPSTSKIIPVYVKSLSNIPINVTVYASDWNPTNCTDYMTLTANPNDFILIPSEVVEVNLTLAVSSDIQGITTFSFFITFAGIG